MYGAFGLKFFLPRSIPWKVSAKYLLRTDLLYAANERGSSSIIWLELVFLTEVLLFKIHCCRIRSLPNEWKSGTLVSTQVPRHRISSVRYRIFGQIQWIQCHFMKSVDLASAGRIGIMVKNQTVVQKFNVL